MVMGDSPVALAIRGHLGAQRGSERATSPTRFQKVSALVVIAHDGDFEKSLQAKQPLRRARIEESAERIILDAVIAQVPHVIVLSSAMAHGAQPHREIIYDHTPTRELTDGFVGDILHFEQSLQRALLNATQGAGGPKVTFLRPAALVGPGIDTLITRHFEAPRLLTLKDGSRNWQFVHIDDVAQAVGMVIEKGLLGTLVVGAVTAAQPAQVVQADLSVAPESAPEHGIEAAPEVGTGVGAGVGAGLFGWRRSVRSAPRSGAIAALLR